LDEVLLGVADWGMLGKKGAAQFVEGFLRFTGEQDGVSGEVVDDAILRDGSASGRSTGPVLCCAFRRLIPFR
jgi:hypothetical protein